MKVDPVSTVSIALLRKTFVESVENSQEDTTIKDRMIQLLSMIMYQQNGLALKLARIAAENYSRAMDTVA